jgi:hypothetical protein
MSEAKSGSGFQARRSSPDCASLIRATAWQKLGRKRAARTKIITGTKSLLFCSANAVIRWEQGEGIQNVAALQTCFKTSLRCTHVDVPSRRRHIKKWNERSCGRIVASAVIVAAMIRSRCDLYQ